MKDPNRYPPGWDSERVRRLIQHYDAQTDEEAIAEDEAAFDDPTKDSNGYTHRVSPIRKSTPCGAQPIK